MILINLISNAIKFSRHDSTVKLKVNMLPTLTEKAVVEVKVTDSGIGIQQNELQ
jgi:signal transduction histidine kinase